MVNFIRVCYAEMSESATRLGMKFSRPVKILAAQSIDKLYDMIKANLPNAQVLFMRRVSLK